MHIYPLRCIGRIIKVPFMPLNANSEQMDSASQTSEALLEILNDCDDDFNLDSEFQAGATTGINSCFPLLCLYTFFVSVSNSQVSDTAMNNFVENFLHVLCICGRKASVITNCKLYFCLARQSLHGNSPVITETSLNNVCCPTCHSIYSFQDCDQVGKWSDGIQNLFIYSIRYSSSMSTSCPMCHPLVKAGQN